MTEQTFNSIGYAACSALLLVFCVSLIVATLFIVFGPVLNACHSKYIEYRNRSKTPPEKGRLEEIERNIAGLQFAQRYQENHTNKNTKEFLDELLNRTQKLESEVRALLGDMNFQLNTINQDINKRLTTLESKKGKNK